MLFRFMQKCGLSLSRAYCIFLKSTNRTIIIFMDGQLDKTVAIGWLSKNTIRHIERPHFCINLNKKVIVRFIVMLMSFQTIPSINYGYMRLQLATQKFLIHVIFKEVAGKSVSANIM